MGLIDNVERWLVQRNYNFKRVKNPKEALFQFIVKYEGSFGNKMEVFEPENQPGILVIGSKITLKNPLIARYQNLSQIEQDAFKKKIAKFCYSIKAVHRFIEDDEDGKIKVGVYIVLDKEEHLNQSYFVEALRSIIEMSDKTSQFLLRGF
jgi:hypothetical protein